MEYFVGQRVNTAQGFGKVAFIRLKSPDYNVVEAVSVKLESKLSWPRYTGTIFTPSEVTVLESL